MCFAILRIKYRDGLANAANTSMDVYDREQLDDRLAALRDQAGVTAVEVFMLGEKHERAEHWVVTPL